MTELLEPPRTCASITARRSRRWLRSFSTPSSRWSGSAAASSSIRRRTCSATPIATRRSSCGRFCWWPHAIAHGHDPFVANVVWAPHGVDLAWVTSSPTLSPRAVPAHRDVRAGLLVQPCGPRRAAARRVDDVSPRPPADEELPGVARRRLPVRLLAVRHQPVGHPPQPVLRLSRPARRPACRSVLRRKPQLAGGTRRCSRSSSSCSSVSRRRSSRRSPSSPSSCSCSRLSCSTSRRRLVALARVHALAYVAVAVIVSPYLVHAFGGDSAAPVRPRSSLHILDLANILIPTKTTWLTAAERAAITSRFTSGLAEIGGYLGIPLLLILLLAVSTMRPAASAAVSGCSSSRPSSPMRWRWDRMITMNGHAASGKGSGRWSSTYRRSARRSRFDSRCTPSSSSRSSSRCGSPSPARAWRYVLAGVAIVCFLPNPSGAFWTSHVRQPGFFTTAAYAKVIRRATARSCSRTPIA